VDKRLDGVWDDDARAAGKAAFLKTGKPWAASAWTEVEHQLDAYAQTWVGLRRAACEAHDDVSDALAGRHLVCLSRRLEELDAVAQLFSRADADVVERAVATAGSLPPLEVCTRDARTALTPKAEHEDLRAGLAAAKARLDAAKYADAVEKARTVADSAARVDDKATLAEARLFMALGTARQGDLKTADALLDDAVLLATVVQEDELIGRAWAERVGFAALGATTPEQGDRWVRVAKAQLERLGNPLELEAILANNQGVLAWSRGRTEDAIASHQRALELRTRLYGPSSPLTARAHTNLGTDYKAAGRLTDAEAEYRTALAIEERALTPEHPAVAETLNNLANVLLARRDTKGARAAMERALAIKERESGPESLTVAVTLTNLGALLLDAGELPAAEGALSRALALKEKASGADSLTVAATLTNVAELRRRQRRWDDAVAADARALEIRKVRVGAQHKDLASNLTGLGRSWLGAGKPDAAKAPLEQALRIRTEPGPSRGETELWLAKALKAKRSGDGRVKELLEQAAVDLPTDDPQHVEAKALLDQLGGR
jgi:tetratricopeptide (TPR) repeat protein